MEDFAPIATPIAQLPAPKPPSSHRLLLVGGYFLLISALLYGGIYMYGKSYTGRVLPGIFVGDIGIGGMRREEVTQFLHTMNDKILAEGAEVTVDVGEKKGSFTFYPVVTGGEDSVVLFDINIDAEADRLMAYDRPASPWLLGFAAVRSRLGSPHLALEHVRIDQDRLKIELTHRGDEYGTAPVDAGLQISSVSPLRYVVTAGKSGVNFDYDSAIKNITAEWRFLSLPHVSLQALEEKPNILELDATKASTALSQALVGGFELVYDKDGATTTQRWMITRERLSTWVEVQKLPDGVPVLRLNKERISKYLIEIISPDVEIPAENARFIVDKTGKVNEFAASHSGVDLDVDTTVAAIELAFAARLASPTDVSSSIMLATTEVAPAVTTKNVNGLGITEVLGVGTSNFAGSPNNRVKNIKNAVGKLNGLLISPGEEFSAISSTMPYTLEGGYLPELVIKGDAIKPEIGGGLCQIGTTLFRMAMNSGLLITERQNHSLVVSYYNDPRNSLPGTDATIYDPAPDFRFKNDTGNYVLIQANMNTKTGALVFSLWGTSDGRKGSYTKPVVSKWYEPGEKRTTLTDKLPVGTEQCQHAYRGADTSFVYTRILSDGAKEDKVFDSHYRALPQICLEGTGAVSSTPAVVTGAVVN